MRSGDYIISLAFVALPLPGFTKGGDAASFRRRRYVELKHGRVAMLACMGYIVPEYYRWPGELSPSLGIKFTDVPTGFAAFSKVPLSGWAQMVAFAGSVELFQYVDDPKRAPGDFENAGLLGIPNGFMKAPEGQKEKKLAAEIANGRLGNDGHHWHVLPERIDRTGMGRLVPVH